MAKAKKTESKAKTKSVASTPKAQKPQAGGAPMIDTNFAAQAAARMLAAKAKTGSTNQGGSSGRESAGFREMKDSLNKSAAHVVTTSLSNTFGEHKHDLPAVGQNQVAVHYSQTNPSINRVNVPRRTAG